MVKSLVLRYKSNLVESIESLQHNHFMLQCLQRKLGNGKRDLDMLLSLRIPSDHVNSNNRKMLLLSFFTLRFVSQLFKRHYFSFSFAYIVHFKFVSCFVWNHQRWLSLGLVQLCLPKIKVFQECVIITNAVIWWHFLSDTMTLSNKFLFCCLDCRLTKGAGVCVSTHRGVTLWQCSRLCTRDANTI